MFPGSNCDRDLYYALERAGFRPRYLWHADTALPPLEAVFLPGAFRMGIIYGRGLLPDLAGLCLLLKTFGEGAAS